MIFIVLYNIFRHEPIIFQLCLFFTLAHRQYHPLWTTWYRLTTIIEFVDFISLHSLIRQYGHALCEKISTSTQYNTALATQYRLCQYFFIIQYPRRYHRADADPKCQSFRFICSTQQLKFCNFLCGFVPLYQCDFGTPWLLVSGQTYY